MASQSLTSVLLQIKSAFTKASDVYHTGSDATKISLPQFVRPMLIESPCFIQSSLIEDPEVVSNILKNLYNLYIGYLLTALQMNELVVGNRRVRDVIAPITTVGPKDALESFTDINLLVEGLQECMEAITLAPNINVTINTPPKTVTPNKNAGKMMESEYHTDKSMSIPIASGRQVEVKFATPEGGESISLVLNVKFNTRVLPEQVVEYILSQDYTQGISERWLKYRAGEISFVKDFVFGVDKLKRRARALKNDKEHALIDLFNHKSNMYLKRMADVARKDDKRSYNIANSILMIDEDTYDRYAKSSGFNIDNVSDRERFFENTYNLFIVLVDNRYSRIKLYTNGISQSSTYSFNELKASGSSDKMSLADVMGYLSKSTLPKF